PAHGRFAYPAGRKRQDRARDARHRIGGAELWVPGGSVESNVHKIDDPLQGKRGSLGGRIANKTLPLTLVEGKLNLAAALAVTCHEAFQIDPWVHDIVAALHIKYRGHLDSLATVQNTNRIALFHRLLRLPKLDVQGNNAIDLLRVFAARSLQALGVVETAEWIDDRPDQHDGSDGGIELGVAQQRDGGVARVARAHG